MEKLITKIELTKRNKNRVNIYLNEEFGFACSIELVYYYNLEKGKKINLDLLKDIIEEDDYLKGKSDALKIIEKSYKTEKEVRNKLDEKGYNDKTICRVLKFLKQYEFVDDFKYVDIFIKEKINSNGRKKIKYMLLKKGIEESIIDEKLRNIDESFEKKIALNLGLKKYNILIKSEKDMSKIYRKIGSYLAYRGYDFNIINNILHNIVDKERINYSDEKSLNLRKGNIDDLQNMAIKRYNIIIKSCNDYEKIYGRLGRYLIRKGYKWEDIKKILKRIMDDE